MHEDFLPGLDTRPRQTFVSCDTNQWQGRRLPHRQVFRLVSCQVAVCHDVFGKCTGQICQSTSTTIDFIANRITCNALANRLDRTCKVHSEDGGIVG